MTCEMPRVYSIIYKVTSLNTIICMQSKTLGRILVRNKPYDHVEKVYSGAPSVQILLNIKALAAAKEYQSDESSRPICICDRQIDKVCQQFVNSVSRSRVCSCRIPVFIKDSLLVF